MKRSWVSVCVWDLYEYWYFSGRRSFTGIVDESAALSNSLKLARMQHTICMQATLLKMKHEYLANMHHGGGPPW